MSWSISIGTIAGTVVRIHITFLLSSLAIAYTDRIMAAAAAGNFNAKH